MNELERISNMISFIYKELDDIKTQVHSLEYAVNNLKEENERLRITLQLVGKQSERPGIF